jgi:hypothetical protein
VKALARALDVDEAGLKVLEESSGTTDCSPAST